MEEGYSRSIFAVEGNGGFCGQKMVQILNKMCWVFKETGPRGKVTMVHGHCEISSVHYRVNVFNSIISVVQSTCCKILKDKG